MRAVGRIVVCVDADAEVSTEKSSSFCRSPSRSTRLPSAAEHVVLVGDQEAGPGVGLCGGGDDT